MSAEFQSSYKPVIGVCPGKENLTFCLCLRADSLLYGQSESDFTNILEVKSDISEAIRLDLENEKETGRILNAHWFRTSEIPPLAIDYKALTCTVKKKLTEYRPDLFSTVDNIVVLKSVDELWYFSTTFPENCNQSQWISFQYDGPFVPQDQCQEDTKVHDTEEKGLDENNEAVVTNTEP